METIWIFYYVALYLLMSIANKLSGLSGMAGVCIGWIIFTTFY